MKKFLKIVVVVMVISVFVLSYVDVGFRNRPIRPTGNNQNEEESVTVATSTKSNIPVNQPIFAPSSNDLFLTATSTQ